MHLGRAGTALASQRYAIHAGYGSRLSFLIICAQQAGTTALFYYAGDHPNIVALAMNEVHTREAPARSNPETAPCGA